MSKPILFAGFLVVTSLCGGCAEWQYRAETRWNADGTLFRAIYQPAAATPEAIRNAKGWSKTTYSKQLSPEEWSAPISSLPAAKRSKANRYFAAWGTFARASDIPDHFVRRTANGKRIMTLTRSVGKNDLVFVAEHTWSESLRDIVTRNDMIAARKDLAKLGVSALHKILTQYYGDRYDWSALVKWAENDGTDWFFAMTDAYYDAGIRQHAVGENWRADFLHASDFELVRSRLIKSDNRILIRFGEVSKRFGLDLFQANGQLESGEKSRKRFELFAHTLLKNHVRRRDGNPLNNTDVEDLFKTLGQLAFRGLAPIWRRCWLENFSKEEYAAFQKSLRKHEKQPDRQVNSQLDAAINKVLPQNPAARRKFQQRLQSLFTRIVGLHWGLKRRLTYTLEVPGLIAETNGELLTPRKVRWTFHSSQAYGIGYEMKCRWLRADEGLQRKVLHGVCISTLPEMVDYVDTVSGQSEKGTLLRLLRKCAATGSIKPLRDYHDDVADDPKNLQNEGAELSRLKRLISLLSLDEAEDRDNTWLTIFLSGIVVGIALCAMLYLLRCATRREK